MGGPNQRWRHRGSPNPGREAAIKASEVSVGALVYTVTSTVSVVDMRGDGTRSRVDLGPTTEFLPLLDALREELRDTHSVACGEVPRLRAFTSEWGRRLLPPDLPLHMPDVLVIVPHGTLHDIPLHLIECGEAPLPLGAQVGIAYASSMTLFGRCVSRNPARRRDPAAWEFGVPGGPAGNPRPESIVGVCADVVTGHNRQFGEIAERLRAFRDDERLAASEWPATRLYAKAMLLHPKDPADVVCIAAHGYVDPQNHRMSGLLMGKEVGGLSMRVIPLHGGRYFDFRDLPLRDFPPTIATTCPAEVFAAAEMEDALPSHLVALIGCSAGWGRVLQADEPASLAETMLRVGAPSVVAPLWDCDMQAASDWTFRFFEGWMNAGLPKALAAAGALRHLSQHEFPGRPECYGAITLRGDWL